MTYLQSLFLFMVVIFNTLIYSDAGKLETIRAAAREIIGDWSSDQSIRLEIYYKEQIDLLGENAIEYPELLFRYYSAQLDSAMDTLEEWEFTSVQKKIIAISEEHNQKLRSILKNGNASVGLLSHISFCIGLNEDLAKTIAACHEEEEFLDVIEQGLLISPTIRSFLSLEDRPVEELRMLVLNKMQKEPEFLKKVFDLLQMVDDDIDIALFIYPRVKESFEYDEVERKIVCDFEVKIAETLVKCTLGL